MSATMPKMRGISRKGLDAAFEEQETRKSNLILHAHLLRAQGKHGEAAELFAQAAQIRTRCAQYWKKRDCGRSISSTPSAPPRAGRWQAIFTIRFTSARNSWSGRICRPSSASRLRTTLRLSAPDATSGYLP